MDTARMQQGFLTIQPGEVLRLRDAAGRHLGVVNGAVWITQHGDPRDPVLEAGASFRFERNGLSLVQPLGGPATLALEDGLAPQDASGRKPSEGGVWQLARSERFQRQARQLRARTLASLSDHLLRDLGLRRDQVRFGAHTRECLHC